MKVRRVVAGTLVRRSELGGIDDRVVAIDVEAHEGRRVVVDVIGVVLRAIPREDLEEGVHRGDISPRCAGEDGALWHLAADEVLQL